MLWLAAALVNASIGIAFTLIAFTIARGLAQTGQLTKNSLGLGTAAIFASCALGHFVHSFHLAFPDLDPEIARAVRQSVDAHIVAVDGVTLLAACFYWGQRVSLSTFLTGGELFNDLQRRFADQTRELASKGRIADAFQRALAPRDLPRAAGISFDATYVPAEIDAQVGGDWYDVFLLPKRRIGFMLGDVTGHGIDAAVASGRVREAIITTAYGCGDPGEVLTAVNATACHRGLPLVTAVFGIIDIDTLDVRYALAGHPPPVLAHRAGSVHLLPHGGLPLGVDPAERYRTCEVEAHQGTLLILYTDGVTEFKRDLIDGEGRLLRAAAKAVSARSLVPARDLLVDVFGDRPARDDVAVLVVKFLGEPRISVLPNGRRWSFDVSDYEAASDLRRRVMESLRSDARLRGDYQAVELILGELLGNVARHTPGAIVVDFQLQDGRAYLSVSDEGPGMCPGAPSLPDDALAETGRGMFLIGTLARSYDVRSSAAGTTVRAELPLDAVASAERDLSAAAG
jgi:serine phosphatase RsbU (regulator of sigma subunit)/anti-sigma regulatory factor (Ser/Thr protein kinase)